MDFDWDEKKNLLNIEKHGIDFNDAKNIFNHPILSREDNRNDYGEKRWIGIGLINDSFIVIVYTFRKNVIRIISARKANLNEREIYNEKFR